MDVIEAGRWIVYHGKLLPRKIAIFTCHGRRRIYDDGGGRERQRERQREAERERETRKKKKNKSKEKKN
jgi:hypothetical protein